MQMAGRTRDAGREGVRAFLREAFDHTGEGGANPLRCEGSSGLVAGAVAMHATGLEERVVLRELGFVRGNVDGKSFAPVLA